MAATLLRRSVASRESLSETTLSLDDFVRRARLARELTPGSTLGRFRIVRRLGMGAMGVVFAAHDPELDRGVALKVLFDDVEPGADSALSAPSDRLRNEARSMAKFNHPNAVTVYEVNAANGRIFLAMELVVGTTVQDWLTTKPPVRETVRLFQGVVLAVHAGHQAGIVHRDLKPQNILVTLGGEPKVTDFGLARATATNHERAGALIGTPSYMAPEALNGRAAGPAADQFSLAVCVHEALCGLRPYRATSLEELRSAMRTDPASAVDRRIAAPLRAVLTRALAYDAAARFPTARAFGEALVNAQANRPRLFVPAAIAGVAIASAAAAVMSGAWSVSSPNRGPDAVLQQQGAAAEHALAKGGEDPAPNAGPTRSVPPIAQPPIAQVDARLAAPRWQAGKRHAVASAQPEQPDVQRSGGHDDAVTTDDHRPTPGAPSKSTSAAVPVAAPVAAIETTSASASSADWMRSRL